MMSSLPGSVWPLLAFCLVFIPGCVRGCSKQEFACTLESCVPEDRVCDFTDNCGDGSDEKNCSTYNRYNFEKGFCDLNQSSETFSEWARTTEASGLKNDHSNTSAYFLSLSPDGANRTTADLISPVFRPTQTCQMSFYCYVAATHGDLQVLVQTHPLGQSTVTWKNSVQQQMGTWLQTVIQFSSNYSFQVVIRGEFSAEGEASEVLAIDDLSFSPGCLTAPGPVTPQPLTCSTDQFQCAYSFQCIPKNFWCDKEPNCADQSDEEHCPAFVPGTIPPQLLCLIGFYQCSDSLCLPSILRCDGVPDCPDGDDEYSCPLLQCELGELVCEAGPPACIPLQKRCDDLFDCLPFRSDESSCQNCPPMFCLDRGSCHMHKHGPVCICSREWTGNRCHMKAKPSPTLTPEPEDMDDVYTGITIGLLLLVAGVAVCVLATCRRKYYLLKPDQMNYEEMYDSAFDHRAELPSPRERPCICPTLNPRKSDGRGLSISVYPWKREVEQASTWRDAKLSFTNPLYNSP